MKTPEYNRLFDGEPASRRMIEFQSPYLIHSVDQLVRLGAVTGQRELPAPVGTGDIIYQYNGPVAEKALPWPSLDYVVFEQ